MLPTKTNSLNRKLANDLPAMAMALTDQSSRHHGGRLRITAQRYGIALSQWLDLSTGINPRAWPVPELPASVWARLPEDEDDLITSAQDYYNSKALLAIAGSQAVIQCLPFLRPACRVCVLTPSYAEHAYAWQARGHHVEACGVDEIEKRLPHCDVLVLVNPNNPTAHRFEKQQLMAWHEQLARRHGWLVVDEAYLDAQSQHSLMPHCPEPGLIVLRSLGKYFGLAGLRVGFVAGEIELLQRIAEFLGPWTVNGPARWVASRALRDVSWQQQTRNSLRRDSQRLFALLSHHGLRPKQGCELFQWVVHAQAAELHHRLCQQGILTRLFAQPASLRFGLPGTENEWRYLAEVLQQLHPSAANVSCTDELSASLALGVVDS